jgi:hypothetical protein
MYTNRGVVSFTAPEVTHRVATVKTTLANTNFSNIELKNLPNKVDEIEGFSLIGAQAGGKDRAKVRLTKNGRMIGNSTGVNRWKIHISDPEANVNIYKTGTIQIYTKGKIEPVLRYLDSTYFPGISSLGFNISKIDGKVYMDRELDPWALYDEIAKNIPSSQIEMSRHPRNFGVGGNKGFASAVKFTWKNPRVTMSIMNNGTIIFNGLKSDADIGLPVMILRTIFAKIDLKTALIMNGPPLNKPEGPARLNKQKKKNRVAAMRYNAANSYNSTKPGFYVRPGPDGKPRFYEVPTNPSLVRAKVIKAYAAVGERIRPAVKEILGIEGSPNAPENNATEPPKNVNNKRNGFYVRPDKKGMLKWYKIPTGKAKARPIVVKAYAQVGMNIPQHIKNMFKIEEEGTGQHLVNMNRLGVIRINGKQLSRYNKASLVRIAHNMNVAEARPNMNIANLQRVFTRHLATKQAPNLILNGTKHTFLANGSIRRDIIGKPSRTRQFSSLPAKEQDVIAKAYLTANKHAEYNTVARKDKYTYILMNKNSRKAKAPSPRAKTPSPAKSKTPSPTNSAMNREFELALILQQNMGNAYRNGNEMNLMRRMNALPSGARGKPLKANINRVTKKFIKETVSTRTTNSIKNAYKAKINVPNWLPSQYVNSYKSILTNAATTKTNGKYPKQSDLKVAMQAWLNSHVRRSPARVARNVENAITGEVRHIPAYNPPVRTSPVIPKFNKPAPKKRAPKVNKPAVVPKRSNYVYNIPVSNATENLGNAIMAAGLNVRSGHTWNELVRAGVNKKFKNVWNKYVATQNFGAAGPIKRT